MPFVQLYDSLRTHIDFQQPSAGYTIVRMLQVVFGWIDTSTHHINQVCVVSVRHIETLKAALER